MAIENRKNNTYVFYSSTGQMISIYPGINFLPTAVETIIKTDPLYPVFVKDRIFVDLDIDPDDVKTDKETGMNFIEDTGIDEKVPVTGLPTEPPIQTQNPVGIKFKSSELKKHGISADSATKIIYNMPTNGYTDISEIPGDISPVELETMENLIKNPV